MFRSSRCTITLTIVISQLRIYSSRCSTASASAAAALEDGHSVPSVSATTERKTAAWGEADEWAQSGAERDRVAQRQREKEQAEAAAVAALKEKGPSLEDDRERKPMSLSMPFVPEPLLEELCVGGGGPCVYGQGQRCEPDRPEKEPEEEPVPSSSSSSSSIRTHTDKGGGGDVLVSSDCPSSVSLSVSGDVETLGEEEEETVRARESPSAVSDAIPQRESRPQKRKRGCSGGGAPAGSEKGPKHKRPTSERDKKGGVGGLGSICSQHQQASSRKERESEKERETNAVAVNESSPAVPSSRPPAQIVLVLSSDNLCALFVLGVLAILGCVYLWKLATSMNRRCKCPLCQGVYTQRRQLGEGGYGTVFTVERERRGKEKEKDVFVMKKIPVTDITEADSYSLEAKRLLTLRHKYVVSYESDFIHFEFEYGRFDPRCFFMIVMEFCSGGDLKQKIEHEHREFTEETIRRVFFQTLQAVHYLHENNLLHRDIKSQNIFLSADGTLRLGDLGLSRKFHPRDKVRHLKPRRLLKLFGRREKLEKGRREEHRRTPAGTAMTQAGTDVYMAPEMLLGARYGKPADVWGLGCVLYELCSGVFMWELDFVLGSQVLTQPAVVNDLIDRLPPLIPDTLRSLLRRLLSPDAAHRPTTSELLRRKYFKRQPQRVSRVPLGSCLPPPTTRSSPPQSSCSSAEGASSAEGKEGQGRSSAEEGRGSRGSSRDSVVSVCSSDQGEGGEIKTISDSDESPCKSPAVSLAGSSEAGKQREREREAWGGPGCIEPSPSSLWFLYRPPPTPPCSVKQAEGGGGGSPGRKRGSGGSTQAGTVTVSASPHATFIPRDGFPEGGEGEVGSVGGSACRSGTDSPLCLPLPSPSPSSHFFSLEGRERERGKEEEGGGGQGQGQMILGAGDGDPPPFRYVQKGGKPPRKARQRTNGSKGGVTPGGASCFTDRGDLNGSVGQKSQAADMSAVSVGGLTSRSCRPLSGQTGRGPPSPSQRSSSFSLHQGRGVEGKEGTSEKGGEEGTDSPRVSPPVAPPAFAFPFPPPRGPKGGEEERWERVERRGKGKGKRGGKVRGSVLAFARGSEGDGVSDCWGGDVSYPSVSSGYFGN